MLSIIAEADPKNPAQLTNWPPVNWTPFWEQQESLPSEPLSGKRIGYFTEALGTDARVDDAFENAKNQLIELGAELFEVSEILKPGTNYASYQVMLYEYHIGLNDYLGRLDSQIPIHSISDLIAFNKQDTVELKYFGQEYLEYAQAMIEYDGEITVGKLITTSIKPIYPWNFFFRSVNEKWFWQEKVLKKDAEGNFLYLKQIL